ncbi:MAG: CU044_5270 family protein [Streptosporangiaceae bacterium]|nr:CU044_5270 family protein [Streptosporangiaceae bacterium]MBV9855713.1 CU044_5270 family protein [Streptosporangiaceae bacterium]
MNDLDLLTELGNETRLPRLSDLAPARAQLTAAIDAETASPGRVAAGRGPSWRGPWRGRRRGRRIAVSAIVVATAAASVALIVTGGPPRHAAPGPASAVRLTAYQILDRAAAAALTEPTVLPRPDQYVYTKVSDGAEGVVQSWLSVDGKRNGLVVTPKGPVTQPGCVNGHVTVRMPGKNGRAFTGKKPVSVKNPATFFDGPLVTKPCVPQPAYFPDMPSSPAGALAYLSANVWNSQEPVIPVGVSKAVSQILGSDYLLPAQRSALYTLLTRVPGLSVVHGVRDTAGRPGVGVEWTDHGARGMNIFDPRTFAYLGTTVWDPSNGEQGRALTQVAIVNHPGQLP